MKRYVVEYVTIDDSKTPDECSVWAESPEHALRIVQRDNGDINGVMRHKYAEPKLYAPPTIGWPH